MSTADQLKAAFPVWQSDPAQPVVIRHRSGSVSSRKAYPASQRPRFVPPRSHENYTELLSVGEGNDVYLDPEEEVDPLSEEAKNRVRRIRNVGGGAGVLVEDDPEAEGERKLQNELRTIKANPSALLSVTEKDETIEVDSIGPTSTILINIDGQIGTNKGIVHTLIQGRRGTTGVLRALQCGEDASPITILEWEEGQIISASLDFQVGDCCDCGSTCTPGPL